MLRSNRRVLLIMLVCGISICPHILHGAAVIENPLKLANTTRLSTVPDYTELNKSRRASGNTGPSLNVCLLPKGTLVWKKSESKDPQMSHITWKQVKVTSGWHKGKEGWVECVLEPLTNSQGALQPAPVDRYQYLTVGLTKLRSEPSMKKGKRDDPEIPKDTPVDLLDWSKDEDDKVPINWYLTKILDGPQKGKQGWISVSMIEDTGPPTVEVLVLAPHHEYITSPGHVALRVGAEVYNFGDYWEEVKWGIPPYIPGILVRDNPQQYIQQEIPHRDWIWGFELPMPADKQHAIINAVETIWQKGIEEKGQKGRKVGEYKLVNQNCVHFTNDLLKIGGLDLVGTGKIAVFSIPDMTISDKPSTIRDNFLQWQKDDPTAVIIAHQYK